MSRELSALSRAKLWVLATLLTELKPPRSRSLPSEGWTRISLTVPFGPVAARNEVSRTPEARSRATRVGVLPPTLVKLPPRRIRPSG